VPFIYHQSRFRGLLMFLSVYWWAECEDHCALIFIFYWTLGQSRLLQIILLVRFHCIDLILYVCSVELSVHFKRARLELNLCNFQQIRILPCIQNCTRCSRAPPMIGHLPVGRGPVRRVRRAARASGSALKNHVSGLEHNNKLSITYIYIYKKIYTSSAISPLCTLVHTTYTLCTLCTPPKGLQVSLQKCFQCLSAA
jgi:hypothetical protein